MLSDIIEIFLYEERQFEIDIRLANSKYYLATVEINKRNAFLEIFGEVSGQESIVLYEHFKGDNIKYLEGKNLSYKFHFYDSSIFYFKQRSIHGASHRSAFHIKLNVKYFHLSIAHPSSSYKTNQYSTLKIYSPTITNWLGITKKQLEIFKYSQKEKLPSENLSLLCEFEVEIENLFNLNILYNSKWKREHNSKKTISEFPPSLNINFKSPYPDFTSIKKVIKQIKSLFYVLIGQPILIEKAFLCFPSHRRQVPLYLSESSTYGKESENKGMLLKYNSGHLLEKEYEPVFPVESFRNFFLLNENKKDLFSKFSTYDQIQNTEEKFLGLFRVVENFVYVESLYVEEELLRNSLETLKNELIDNGVKSKTAKGLLGRFLNVNKQRINAESAIDKFLKSLDEDIYNDISHLKSDITKIVKLRNDITHCNQYTLEENEIEKYIIILNYLCTLLLWREIGLSHHCSFRNLHKYQRYRIIKEK